MKPTFNITQSGSLIDAALEMRVTNLRPREIE